MTSDPATLGSTTDAMLLIRLGLLRAEGKAHAVRLTRVDEGMPEWAFDCLHGPNDEKWASREQDGTISPYWAPGECWLESWWSEYGGELLDLHGSLLSFPLPVKIGDDWDYDNGGVLVVDQ